MTAFLVGLIDETGCPFATVIEADNRGDAWDIAEEDYPESRVESVSTCEEVSADIARYNMDRGDEC